MVVSIAERKTVSLWKGETWKGSFAAAWSSHPNDQSHFSVADFPLFTAAAQFCFVKKESLETESEVNARANAVYRDVFFLFWCFHRPPTPSVDSFYRLQESRREIERAIERGAGRESSSIT